MSEPDERATQAGAGVEEATLPLSGAILQWRASDASYRHLAGRGDAAERPWHTWTGTEDVTVQADGNIWESPSWVVVAGELPPGGQVEVLRTDDTPVPVVTVGRAWMAEWVGHGEPVTVQYDGNFPRTVRPNLPDSLRRG